MHLIVTESFASYARGDRITDPAVIEAVQIDHPGRVVPVAETEAEPAAQE